jgi:S-adenosylmethionine-diacylglycerol 3-amino-3-carboxypropyl transferase
MFTQSWEDPACDLAALRPQPGETIFAIISGCDNVLGFLLTDPARVIAVDLNPTQTYLLELKRAAFRGLSHAEMLELLGVRASTRRRSLYERLRDDLNPAALGFWDNHRPFFDLGLLVRGGFERYYALVRTLLRVVIGRHRLEKLFTLQPDAQRGFYDREWDTWRWRILLRLVCSKYILGKKLDPTWFTHAEITSFGEHFTRIAEHAIAELPARSNYFLAQLLLGGYLDEDSVPDYLRAEHFETIRCREDRIHAEIADVGAAIKALDPQSIDCFALSNVFEYSPQDLFEQTLPALVRAARPGARFALRNLLAPRRLADHAEFWIDAELSAQLREADRGFIYSRFEAASLASAKGGSSWQG